MSDESERWRKACMEFALVLSDLLSRCSEADELQHTVESLVWHFSDGISRHGLSLDAPAGETKACEHMWRFIREVPPYYCCEKCGEPKP